MSNSKIPDSNKLHAKGSKLAWAPNEKASESSFSKSENTPKLKQKPHTSFLFFGHDRVQPHRTTNQSDQWHNEKSKMPPSKEQDPFTKKVSELEKNAETKPKVTFCGKILQMWADDDSTLRLSWSSLALVIFSFAGGGIFYAIERNSKCNWNYWESLWFFNTIYTTIGYGTLSPCSAGGKVAAVISALVGILLNVIALGDVGKLLTRLLHRCWVYLRRLYRLCKKCCSKKPKNATKLIDENTMGEPTSLDVPLSFALFVTLMWFVISALFFHFSETDNMTIGDSFYFVMISVTTIGFGDVAPKDYKYAIIQFFFIIIGIALFSMVYNIIQDKLNGLSDSVEELISKEYMKAQQEGTLLTAGDDEKAAREYIRSVIKKQKGGGLLSLVMGKNAENRLVQDYMEKSKKRLVSTQTDNIVHDVSITAIPETVDVYIQALPAMAMNGQDKGTQLKWMPTTLLNGADWKPKQYNNSSSDWLNLMHSARTVKNKTIPSSITHTRTKK